MFRLIAPIIFSKNIPVNFTRLETEIFDSNSDHNSGSDKKSKEILNRLNGIGEKNDNRQSALNALSSPFSSALLTLTPSSAASVIAVLKNHPPDIAVYSVNRDIRFLSPGTPVEAIQRPSQTGPKASSQEDAVDIDVAGDSTGGPSTLPVLSPPPPSSSSPPSSPPVHDDQDNISHHHSSDTPDHDVFSSLGASLLHNHGVCQGPLMGRHTEALYVFLSALLLSPDGGNIDRLLTLGLSLQVTTGDCQG